jgi:flavin reductase (DIM6/NTAB) family NADH-FMN oxidoreductase RutF
MTIGWAFIGLMWWKPTFIVMVRPVRHTFTILEKTDEFTVNVPGPGMEETVAYCGKVSGRDHDKFTERGLIAQPGLKVKVPVIAQCPVNYECKVLYRQDLIPGSVPPEVVGKFYPNRDFHRLYFGEILSVQSDRSDPSDRSD